MRGRTILSYKFVEEQREKSSMPVRPYHRVAGTPTFAYTSFLSRFPASVLPRLCPRLSEKPDQEETDDHNEDEWKCDKSDLDQFNNGCRGGVRNRKGVRIKGLEVVYLGNRMEGDKRYNGQTDNYDKR